jgi:hypothetical protein
MKLVSSNFGRFVYVILGVSIFRALQLAIKTDQFAGPGRLLIQTRSFVGKLCSLVTKLRSFSIRLYSFVVKPYSLVIQPMVYSGAAQVSRSYSVSQL